MFKNDLIKGMIVVLRDGSIRTIDTSLFGELGMFDGECRKSTLDAYSYDLSHTVSYEDDVVKIYNKDFGLLWERGKFDWSKVPFGAKVRVWNDNGNYKYEGRFLKYDDLYDNNYKVFVDNTSISTWDNCELIEDVNEEVTAKELYQSIQSRICDGECLNCEYSRHDDVPCKYNWIVNNYNVTIK